MQIIIAHDNIHYEIDEYGLSYVLHAYRIKVVCNLWDFLLNYNKTLHE